MRKFIITGVLAASFIVPTVASAAQGQPGTEASKVKTHKPCKQHSKGKKCTFIKQVKKARNGKNGVNGVNGTNGVNGRDGSNGGNGVNGKDGARGPQGIQGLPGLNGKDGHDGVSGYEVRTFDYIKGIGHRDGMPGMDAGYSGVGGGAPATVVCSSPDKVAIAGGYWIRDGADERMDQNFAATSNGAGVIASFPGRMNWDTNSPRPGVNSGWIVRFNAYAPTDVTLYVVCISAS